MERDRRDFGGGLVCRGASRCRCYSKVTHRRYCCNCMTGPCFPGQSKLTLTNGDIITMDKLESSQEILTVDPNGNNIIPTKVVAFLDRRPTEWAQYLRISTDRGKELLVSPNHIVYKMETRDAASTYKTSYAKSVETGDVLLINDNRTLEAAVVTDVHAEIMKGAYVPLTATGNLLVDDVFVSSYSSFDHQMSHIALAPIRWFPTVFGRRQSTIDSYVRFLKRIGNVLLPATWRSGKDENVVIFHQEEYENYWDTVWEKLILISPISM